MGKKLLQNKSMIKVLGIGGSGGNAIKYMLNKKTKEDSLGEIEYIYLNTGKKSFDDNLSYQSLQIGKNVTNGLGAGADPNKGRESAMDEIEAITEIIGETDLLFLTVGMGGGTGSGAIPIVADIAKNKGILTIAIVTKPFLWEGNKRMKIAEAGIEELKNFVDSLIVIPNEKLLPTLGKNTSLLDAFSQVNKVLLNAVDSISDLIINPGFINIDFADVKSVMSNMGMAIMGVGCASGKNRVKTAFERAMFSPLLENIKRINAKGVLVNITCGLDLTIAEFEEIGVLVKEVSSKDVKIVVGSALDKTMKGDLSITLVVTGLEEN